jgi:hypothetical protein
MRQPPIASPMMANYVELGRIEIGTSVKYCGRPVLLAFTHRMIE